MGQPADAPVVARLNERARRTIERLLELVEDPETFGRYREEWTRDARELLQEAE